MSTPDNDCEYWNWNTNCTYEHLTTAWNGPVWQTNETKIAEALGIPESAMDDEYKWIADTVHSYDPSIVMTPFLVGRIFSNIYGLFLTLRRWRSIFVL